MTSLHASSTLRMASRRPLAAGLLAGALALAACSGGAGGAAPGARLLRARRGAPRLVNVTGTAIELHAQEMAMPARDGSPIPMWGYCAGTGCNGVWAPGPTIVAVAGQDLQIKLTNDLKVPTSLVVLGQLGGGLGTPTMTASPAHPQQSYTTFPTNAKAAAPFTPPAQGPRVRSFGTEVAAGGSATLAWQNLAPGTYLYETGTMPSLEVPMGLYGVLVVTTAPVPASAGAPFTPGTAYPGLSYDDDATLLFSEVDPVQNRSVQAAASAGTDPMLRVNDPACQAAGAACYPAAINYTPTYFLINGRPLDRTQPELSALTVGDGTYQTGSVLLRLANAGSRSHVPSAVGLPMALVAEDGHPAPGNPRLQNEVLLTAGKTFDVVVKPAGAAGAGYAPGTFAVFDRALSLNSDGHPDGGMQAFLLVDHAGAPTQTVSVNGVPTLVAVAGAPGNLPAALTPAANPDSFKVPYQTAIGGDVTLNDVGITRVTLGVNAAHGALALNADGTFVYTPNAGYSGSDSFTYVGNGAAALTAAVTLTVGAAASAPVALDDVFTSAVRGRFSAPRPGVLANDSDVVSGESYPITAVRAASDGTTCASLALDPEGSFTVTAPGSATSCTFTYEARNAQGTASAPATVTVNFGASGGVAGLVASVVDATTGAAIADYRWTLQEDLTFKHDPTATPALNTRTIGTSFHRSHMPIVATGCVGATSCGSGQTYLDPATGQRHTVTDAEALARQTTLDQVVLDPTKNYYVSILPGDGAPPGHAMGGGEVHAGHVTDPLTVKVEATPLVTAQMSVYIYEDSGPTNGQDDLGETGLGGFNIILVDPAGRTGDPAGQQSYDAFNMPLSNWLLGSPGCPDELDPRTNGTATSPGGNVVGVVYTCPNPPPGYRGDPARYALAGHALIKNLTPARYDVIAHPAAAREGAGEVWWQTETLEGTPAQDAFVGVNEPVYFQEFGPPGPHVTIGFVNPAHVAAYAQANGIAGTHVVKGQVTNQHMSRPSDVTLWDSGSYDLLSSTTCEVVLNSQSGNGPAVAAGTCDADGNFALTGLPPGSYELDIFDQWLDQIIQSAAVVVPAATQTVDLGTVAVLSWFTQHDQNIFQDLNGNGQYDPGEPGISNVPLTVRYRNGAISNVTLTDSSGNGLLPELFPLFNWYVAEADTTRFKQTGVTVTVDGGGQPDASGAGAGLYTSHYATGESSVRTELPGSYSYGVQGFISQRNRVDWGRAPYAQGENGGVQGVVVYSSTRPFDDQKFNVQTIWEPLVPRVTVNLYRQVTLSDGTRSLALVDTTRTSSFDDWVNLVQGSDGNAWLLGSDGVLRDPATGAAAPGTVTAGAQVNLQCPGQAAGDLFNRYTLALDAAGTTTDRQRCYDGWHDWNQVQAAPYDGRYQFPSAAYVAAHPLTAAQKAAGQTLVSLDPGSYVVEVVPPPGYQIVKEEDKNILIGDAFTGPAPAQFGPLASIFILPDQATLGNANPDDPGTGDPGFQSDPTTNLGSTGATTLFPECVGAVHRVPDYLSLFPGAQQVAPFAGMDRPLCDRKLVVVADQMQSSANFFVFTEVPAASNDTGIILDDASSEFNAYAPDFGEKASVPFVPVSVKDWNGVEIARTYADQWGAYNMMTPSSWLVNPPTPSGYGPNMLVTCINDPGPIKDAQGNLVTDPQFNPAYSNFCYTNPYMPGQTTYLDTPLLPIAAFAAGYNPADCAQPDGTPEIKRVDSSAGFGPWLPATGGTLTIQAQGNVDVQNPGYAGPFAPTGLPAQRTAPRHYGFGTGRGTVTVGGAAMTVASWSDASITVNVPPGNRTGELVVTTASGRTTVDAVTVEVGGPQPTRVAAGGSIQAAVDAAKPGDLILVDGGVYNELVIMWKPVRLQGVGAGAVVINAAKYPNAKLDAWRARINPLFSIDSVTGNVLGTAQVDPLPGQEITGGVVLLEPTVLGSEEGAGITVLAKNLGPRDCNSRTISTLGHSVSQSNFYCGRSRIDGVSVTGGDAGGGIYVNGWAHNLEIANDRVYGNAGAYHGGIRVGVPYLETEALPGRTAGGRIAGLGYDRNVRIHHNSITKNGTVEAPAGAGGAGGGISMCAGSDGYSIDHNYICGNLSASDGGGIGHLGFSQGGTITANELLFNQSFQQTNSTHGGAIVVSGEPPIAGAVTLGTGDLTIDSNVIRGNFAEAGQGGGIRLQQVNGADVTRAPANPLAWHQITVTSNVIVDNVAGWAGGGVSLADALNVLFVNNTVAQNDSSGIAGVVLAGGVTLPGPTTGVAGAGYPGPAGLVSEPTSAALLAQIRPAALKRANAASQPLIFLDIFWRNRSLYYSGDGRLCSANSVAAAGGACRTLADQTTTGQCTNLTSGGAPSYWDVGVLADASVLPGAVRLDPEYSTLTSRTGYAFTNNTTNPAFTSPYCNGARSVPEFYQVVNPPSVRNLQVAATVDEGNNYVNMRYGPLYVTKPGASAWSSTPFGDYRLPLAVPVGLAATSAPVLGGFLAGLP